MSDASIGQHTRHIIELYTCLLDGYDAGVVCYDSRRRDKRIELDLDYSLKQLEEIQNSLEKKDKILLINYELNNRNVCVSSNYFREVMYNLEHTIHHEALVKIAILEFSDIPLPESFGVAPSTVQFRKTCVQ